MSGRLNSITLKKDFDLIFKTGRSSFDKILGFKYLANDSTKIRLGIIISSKISKKAVDRNRLKRRLKEILGKVTQNLTSGCDLLIIALPGSTVKTFNELEESVGKHLIRLRIRKTL